MCIAQVSFIVIGTIIAVGSGIPCFLKKMKSDTKIILFGALLIGLLLIISGFSPELCKSSPITNDMSPFTIHW